MDRTEENRQEYKELQRRVKREVSKAKQKAYDELYTRLDTREGQKDLYRLARQRDRDGKDVQQVKVIKDRDGRVLTSEESVQKRWKEYFEELMNEENEREKRVEGVNSVEQKVDKIRKDEVRKALKRMKSGKAVGPDDIPVEVWKCLGEAAVEFLASLFNRVLESERMPEEWRRSVLVPIFKNKGDMQNCSNYRGIKLMSHTMKLWERVVEARLRKVVEICEQQYGFMPKKSTTDAIFALRILMEKYRDGQREKAYDRVPREELWYCMRKSGVAEKYVRVVQDMYERSRTVVRCAVGQTEEFNVEVGLHQGSALSPFLFAIVMGQLSEEVRQESPWTMMFADDIVICSESREQVEENLERWRFALERRGMKVSRSKTEYMCVNEREGSGTVRLQGEEVKKVQEFKYLGSTVQSNGECGKEVKKRVQAGWNGWRKVWGVLCERKISARIKGKVYRTVVRAAMLYGLETVSLRKRQESELEVAELKMLRFSLGVTRLDRIRNEYIRGTAHVGRLGDKVREARLRWFGHVQRREIGNVVGHENIVSASRMNSAIVVFLNDVEKVRKLTQNGIVVNNETILVSPLSSPDKKVMLCNVPPFISDEAIGKELSRYGRMVSPIKKIPLGCKSPLVRHWVCFRRMVFMVFKEGVDELNAVFKFTVDGFDYNIFVSSDTDIKCFKCGQTGHLARTCPERQSDPSVSERPGRDAAESAGVVPPAAEPRSAQPDRTKSWSTEKSSVGSGAVLEPPALTEAGTEVQGNRMETPDTTPVQGDGGDVDMVDEPIFKLYSSEWSGAQVVEDSFLMGLPKLSEQAARVLDRELSLEELHEALQRMENGRASGIDGLPAEFYKAFWAVIGQDVLDVLRDSIRRGELPLSCRRAVLTLLPKKGDLTHLKNWRPVSLLCTDCKLLSKALASRLTKVMERLIHQDQKYCVPDRSIFDNVYLIRDILDISRLLGLKTGLIFLDQEKAFDRVEHEYLWKVLETFGFNPGCVAMIRVLYCEIESVLKVNGGLCAPFRVYRGIRQGCSLSGMLYSLAIEPLLNKLRSFLSGFNIPHANASVYLSAYADDLVVMINTQEDVNVLAAILNDFQVLSSAKVNWTKSEAILVGEWGGGQPTLPGGLAWKRGGFKYLGVYLGTNEFLNKNWEGSVEHVKGRLSRWKRLVPKMSYRGRTLVINNLAASSLWHKLACVDPPPILLANIQAQLVDFFWDGLHWIPQSVLHLPKEEGGQGLVQLSSRAAAFRLQFIQRLLTGPRDLVWRAAASGLLHTVKGLGLDRALFLMDTKMLDISGLPMFYRGLFKIWNVFKKQNKGCRTVHWLLEEPLVYGGRLDISGVTVPALSRTLVSSGIVTLRELVNVAGSDLSRAEDLAVRVGLRSQRVVNQLLHRWRSALTSEERVQLMGYQHTETGPAEDEPFPRLNIAPDLDGCAGPSWSAGATGRWTLGEDSFELHSVDLELEAVEKQIRDLQVKQSQLRQRKAALESSRTDAHLSQVNSRRETITPTTSTSCASLPRPSARTRPTQVSFTPAPGYHAAWMQQQGKTRAKPRARTSPPPPPLVFEISTQNRFAPLCEMACDAVIIGDSIVRHIRSTSAKGKVHTRCLPGACVLDVWHERHQAEADGDPDEGLQEPGGEGTHHIAHDEDHRVRTTSHVPARNREVQ
ncbi:hypothetical protein QTP70_000286 [Hemibagrus guttatus]|uniref:ribonuclease H n=1 Tax=Hemibagrus guttatus TaxID=175788 RepID=A0AAE0V2D6_9TELE|nr:hypothetical protein QTP70_000286 [Hemibagrus guttatus]